MPGVEQILPLPAPPLDGNLGPLPDAQLPEQPDDDESAESLIKDSKQNSAPTSVTTHTRTIGIIHPPPDIRNIVDKTAQFVAKNGPEFEKRIIANNAGNVKFNFLNGSDPYHAYYQHRLSEFRAQNQPGAQLASAEQADGAAGEPGSVAPTSDGTAVAEY